jgi:hypothetical protein
VGAAAVAGGGEVESARFAAASHAGWWVITACGGLVLVLGLLTTTKWARTTADRTAARFMDEAVAPVVADRQRLL